MLFKKSAILKAVGLVTVISAIGKVLGFIREAIIAAYFGTSEVSDVFFVANLIPTLLFTAVGTAIQAGIIPLYVEEKERNQSAADYMMSVLGTLFFLAAVFITVICFIFADPLVRIVAPGFSEEQRNLTVLLTKIMLPSICFFTLTSIATGVLHAHKKFIMPAFTSTVHNIVIIVFTFFFAHIYGVTGLAVSVLIGAASQFFIQYPQMSKYAIRFNFSFKKEKNRIKNTLRLFYPIIIASVAVQLNGLTDRIISSSLEEGSVSALNYASRLLWLPLSVILSPLITVLYPSIVESVLKGYEEFMEVVSKGIKSIIFLSIPFTVVMIISSQSLIELAFQRGAFDLSATSKTTQAFIFYATGLVFFALRDYLMNCFYALKKTKVAMYSCITAVILNVGLSIYLSKYLSAGGIALASSISMLSQSIFLAVYLWRQTNPSKAFNKVFFTDILKFCGTFILVYITALAFHPSVKGFPNLLRLTVLSSIVFTSFFVYAFILKIREIQLVSRFIKRG
jgi:putative peptidoglycan lipid II flippase